MNEIVTKNISDFKSQCGCRKADELINRFDMIDIVDLYPISHPEQSKLVLRLKVGKTLSGYYILEPIEYCPFCGNRFDGEVAK